MAVIPSMQELFYGELAPEPSHATLGERPTIPYSQQYSYRDSHGPDHDQAAILWPRSSNYRMHGYINSPALAPAPATALAPAPAPAPAPSRGSYRVMRLQSQPPNCNIGEEEEEEEEEEEAYSDRYNARASSSTYSRSHCPTYRPCASTTHYVSVGQMPSHFRSI